jgi:methylmalonyl-CoA/ethylmalonyl-CoA epimerase
VGVVVDDIVRYGLRCSRVLGLQAMSGVVIDDSLMVRVQFWGYDGETSLELIEPYGEKSPVRRSLELGGGLHHLCFEVEDIEIAVEHARTTGGLLIVAPVAAAAFGGRRVAFLFFRDLGLVEFEEATGE